MTTTQQALVALIQQRRRQLGHNGRPVPYDVLAERSGLPRATVHKLATEGVAELRADTVDRLRALAGALELPPHSLERAALDQLGVSDARQVVRLSDDEELLLSTYRAMSEEEVAQVTAFMRFLRSQRE